MKDLLGSYHKLSEGGGRYRLAKNLPGLVTVSSQDPAPEFGDRIGRHLGAQALFNERKSFLQFTLSLASNQTLGRLACIFIQQHSSILIH